ncbi:MAG: ABC transporter substrate-binding protein [Actinomycetota bacterium]
MSRTRQERGSPAGQKVPRGTGRAGMMHLRHLFGYPSRTRLVVALATVLLVALSACSGAKNPSTAQGGTVADGVELESPGLTEQPTSDAASGSTTGATPGTGGKTATAGGSPSPGRSRSTAGRYAPSTLFSPQEDKIGITKDQITVCFHAFLTYGAAFATGQDDMNVFFTALNGEKGGVYGRKLVAYYEDDGNDPQKAIEAAEACKAKNPLFIGGGFGIDQVPAVRSWAEQNHVLYGYSLAPEAGREGNKYSFAGNIGMTKYGEMHAELVVKKYRDKKIGILTRNSPNWEPARTGFKAVAKKYGLKIVAERVIEKNQSTYTQEILDMKNAGVEVVYANENAMTAMELVKQAKAQLYSPHWLVMAVNLVTQVNGDDALNPPLEGVTTWLAYSKGDYTGPFAPYADLMKEFERQYAKYRPNTDLSGPSGDTLFMNWMAQKNTADQLVDCGPDCTRNKLIDTWHSYAPKPVQPHPCEADFSRDPQVGSYQAMWLEAWKSPSGKVNLRNVVTCAEHFV